MKYKGKPVEDMTDQELSDTSYDLQWLLGTRENRLLDRKERHKKIKFDNINPAFIEIQKAIDTEVKLRKARS